jgi:hypothetical protein
VRRSIGLSAIRKTDPTAALGQMGNNAFERKKVKKNTLKYIIDALLFIHICSISVIGMLLAFVIPKGDVYQAGKYFLGLHRHEWGDIHLTLSVSLLVLLVFHIWLNWKWIINSTEHYFGKQWKNALYFFSGAWFMVLMVLWIIKKI